MIRKQDAFTLIELLAVIVILAIIAVIATPLTINVINDARERSFINSVYGLIDGARLLSSEQVFDDGSNEVVVNFTDGQADNTNFKVSGDMPTSGTLHLNSEGKVELKVWSEELEKCAEKSASESEVKLTDTSKEECKIEVEADLVYPIVFENLLANSNEVAAIDPDKNLRYVGADPNNYVLFNKELWRIIGIFGGQAKIIRNEFYENAIKWDNCNNWIGSNINVVLNRTYLPFIENNDITSYNYIDLEHVWNIGGVPSGSSKWTRSYLYGFERGETPAGFSGSSTTSKVAIGLMYPSDYGYSTSATDEICDTESMFDWNLTKTANCRINSWLYNTDYIQWTITPLSSLTNIVLYVGTDGSGRSNYVDKTYGVRPVLYLKSDVKIIDGKGTDQKPYKLGM